MKFLSTLLTLFVTLNAPQLQANDEAILAGQRAEPVTAKAAMVVTSHTLATEIALNILKAGGNAIDAAVAAGFALAVTQPRSGNIGGGGFMLYSPSNRPKLAGETEPAVRS